MRYYCSSRLKSLRPEYSTKSLFKCKIFAVQSLTEGCASCGLIGHCRFRNVPSEMLEVGMMHRASMYFASQSLVVRTRFKALAVNDWGFSGSFGIVHNFSRFKS